MYQLVPKQVLKSLLALTNIRIVKVLARMLEIMLIMTKQPKSPLGTNVPSLSDKSERKEEAFGSFCVVMTLEDYKDALASQKKKILEIIDKVTEEHSIFCWKDILKQQIEDEMK